MSCLWPWPPEVYSLPRLRWEKSLPADLYALCCSLHSLQEQTPQTLSGLCLLSALLFLVCTNCVDAAGKWKLHTLLLSGRWMSFLLREQWIWGPFFVGIHLPYLNIFLSHLLWQRHPSMHKDAVYRMFLKTNATSLQSAQEFCHAVLSHLQRDLTARWFIFGWHSLPKLRCFLSSLFDFQNSLSRLAVLFHFEAFCVTTQKEELSSHFISGTKLCTSFLSVKTAFL